jgi:hypothetical protein
MLGTPSVEVKQNRLLQCRNERIAKRRFNPPTASRRSGAKPPAHHSNRRGMMDDKPVNPRSPPAKWCFVGCLAIAIACVLLAIVALSTAHNSMGVVLMMVAGVSTVLGLVAFSLWDPKS